MVGLLGVYILIGTVVAACIIWYLYFGAGREKRHLSHNKIFTVIFSFLFWALSLFRSKWLINIEELFEWKPDNDKMQNAAVCGKFVRYSVPKRAYCVQGSGVFTFKAADVCNLLNEEKKEEHSYSERDKLIHEWLRLRDESIDEIVELSGIWDQFRFSVIKAIQMEVGEVHYSECKEDFNASEILKSSSRPNVAGWCFDRILRPNGHELLSQPTVRLMIRH